MEKPKAIKDLEKPRTKNKLEKPVLITFQVETELRKAANKKAKNSIITLSEFLRRCTVSFVNNKNIEKQMENLVEQTVSAALSS